MSTKEIKILAVDDSRTIRDMVTFTLKQAGFDTTTACDGVEALDIFAHQTFDLIITDLNMPNMDGFGLIENVRKGEKNPFIPILMLTTEADPEKKERGRSVGATGWIVKPFNPEKLVQVVKKVCTA